jgi:hypothetical protein
MLLPGAGIFLSICEVVPTQTFGRLAIHREWVIDPDGHDVKDKYIMGLPLRDETLFEPEEKIIRRIKRCGFSESETAD